MSRLTITHSHAEGTLIAGTARGDGSADILKSVVDPWTGRAGAWRWSRNLGSWYVARSRDTRAKTPLIEATKSALETAGFDVTVVVDDGYRATADVEADAVRQQERRVDALTSKADHRTTAADAAWEAEKHARDLLPPLGQPILVGHHSERRHRKAIERADNAIRNAFDATNAAQEADRRAAAAAGTTAFRYNPSVVRRRIGRLEADLRRFERARDGYTRTLFTDGRGVKHVETEPPAVGDHRERVLAEIARLTDQIGFWKGELERAAESGASIWDARTVLVGDRVLLGVGWGAVERVNARSVRIAGWSWRVPFDRIKQVETADGQPVRVVQGQRVITGTDPA
ncbi:hypothetical protein E3G68_005342 [Mycobacteroides abscessus]|uniref:DUF3560 domain-containing protein n=1 Tax=Mycobacteroides abscessus TaxID=36809 RepID=UPI001878CB6C|nr:hypothetical protein [Mycobacteroides abscessus]